MPYELTITRKPSYVHAVVTGENSRETVVGYLAELRRRCEAEGCFRVLIEERLEGPRLDVVDVYQIIVGGSDRARGFYRAVAYVDARATGDLMRFAETLAVNRGIPVRVFPTVEEAARWLER